jgi:hypothetical protein
MLSLQGESLMRKTNQAIAQSDIQRIAELTNLQFIVS